VNLAPAEFPKEGTGFDLAIAIAVLRASDESLDTRDLALVGELALDGSTRPVNGVLPMARCLAASGYRRLLVADANAAEAALVDGLTVFGAATLGEVVRVVRKLEAETEPNDLAIGSPLAHEVVWPMWEKLRDDMMAQLDNITIEELCQRARAKGLAEAPVILIQLSDLHVRPPGRTVSRVVESSRLAERALRNLTGYGPLQPLLDDPDVWEISVNAPDAIFAKRHSGASGWHDEVFHDDDHVRRVLTKLLDDAVALAKQFDPNAEAAVNAVYANRIAAIEDQGEKDSFVAAQRTAYEADVDLTLDEARDRLSDPRAVLLVNERSGRAAVQRPHQRPACRDRGAPKRGHRVSAHLDHDIPRAVNDGGGQRDRPGRRACRAWLR